MKKHIIYLGGLTTVIGFIAVEFLGWLGKLDQAELLLGLSSEFWYGFCGSVTFMSLATSSVYMVTKLILIEQNKNLLK